MILGKVTNFDTKAHTWSQNLSSILNFKTKNRFLDIITNNI